MEGNAEGNSEVLCYSTVSLLVAATGLDTRVSSGAHVTDHRHAAVTAAIRAITIGTVLSEATKTAAIHFRWRVGLVCLAYTG